MQHSWLTLGVSTLVTGTDAAVNVTDASGHRITPSLISWGGNYLGLGFFDEPLANGVYTVTLDHTLITDSAGRLLAGNQPNGDYVFTFTVDTTPPSVVNVAPITLVTPITPLTPAPNGNAVPTTLAVQVTYSREMNECIAPAVTLTSDVAGELTLDAARSWWTGDRTYVAVFDVADASLSASGIGITVASASDAVGGIQTPYSGTLTLPPADALVDAAFSAAVRFGS